ncbi:MAG: hypothetical protein H3C59_01750 [Burkholderiaceae bacterium]|nr:hypothetical protein [Burkholderiaceae bacterium]
MDKYISKEQLAEQLGVSIRTIEIWTAERRFPPALKLRGSRLAFYAIEEVGAWLAENLGRGQA